MTREHIIGIHTDDTRSSYIDWMPAWLAHLAGLPESISVPPEAATITSPLVAKSWETLLVNHPIKQLKEFFINGISQGFRIGFKYPLQPLISARQNLNCALQHPDTIEKSLADEISHG